MTEREAKAFLNNLKVCIEEHPIVADWLVEIADRKTEPQTEDCGACEHSRITCRYMECGEPCHYEPKTDWHYDEQDATWYPYKHEDEPQQKSCATCKHALGNWDGESNNCGRCCGADRRFYEPKDEPQYDIDKGTIKCDNCSESGSYKCSKCDGEMYFKRLEIEDEPQTEREGE